MCLQLAYSGYGSIKTGYFLCAKNLRVDFLYYPSYSKFNVAMHKSMKSVQLKVTVFAF